MGSEQDRKNKKTLIDYLKNIFKNKNATKATKATDEISEAEYLASCEGLIRTRRAKAGLDVTDKLTWGLALSGGGIRSATFCFGLLRALAKNKLLRRFDYLSTVSGGGYIGTMLGRLYSTQTPAADVENGLASDGSILLWWMRNNGRYLTPAGFSDRALAAAASIRGIISTNFEVAVLFLFAACVISLPHTLLATIPNSIHFGLLSTWVHLPSVWFWLGPLPLLPAVTFIAAYWIARNSETERIWSASSRALCIGALFFAGAWILCDWIADAHPSDPDSRLLMSGSFGVAVLVAIVVGAVLALLMPHVSPPILRLRVTRWLRNCLLCAVAFMLMGALDALSFFVFFEIRGFYIPGAAGVVSVTAAAIPLLRILAKRIGKVGSKEKNGPSVKPMALANWAGLALVGLLILTWMTLLTAVLYSGTNDYSNDSALVPLHRLIAIAGGLIIYIAITGWGLGQLNLASLHYLYLARLARAYISVGNIKMVGQQGRFPRSPLESPAIGDIRDIKDIDDAVEGDDPLITSYLPHHFGGPFHLVNCCINQTRDDRTGAYNADRKGVVLTVSALGMETGTHWPKQHAQLSGTTIGQWTTMSGAALASGMGSKTASGLAALLFLTGLRLGYWFPSFKGAARIYRGFLPKYRATLSELFASFPGLESPRWYISDGGFFDNTGVYTLLKRRTNFILLADCGEDPEYLFEDIENLVRKARIDYSAEIDFLDPSLLSTDDIVNLDAPSSLCNIGTPLTITKEPGPRYFLVGRIRYVDRSIGTLLGVKPHRTKDLPLDVIAYGDAEPDFPQQSTGNQFFDEAQWESYHKLGLNLSKPIDQKLIDFSIRWSMSPDPPARFATVAAAAGAASDHAPSQKSPRAALSLKSTLGLAAFVSMILAVWQISSEYRREIAAEDSQFASIYETAVKAINDSTTPDASLSAALSAFGNATRDGRVTTFARNASKDVAKAIAERCSRPAAASTEPCSDYPLLLQPPALQQAMWVQYWIGTLSSQWDSRKNSSYRTSVATQSNPNERTRRDIALPCAYGPWGPTQLHIKISDEASRPNAIAFGKLAAKNNIAVMGIDNVVATAEGEEATPPIPWPRPTFIYHWLAQADCSDHMAKLYDNTFSGSDAQSRPLPASIEGKPATIELWLPLSPQRNS